MRTKIRGMYAFATRGDNRSSGETEVGFANIRRMVHLLGPSRGSFAGELLELRKRGGKKKGEKRKRLKTQ